MNNGDGQLGILNPITMKKRTENKLLIIQIEKKTSNI